MSIPANVRAIVFDAVGTVIAPYPSAPQTYARIGRRFGSQLSVEEIGRRFREAFQGEEQFDRQQDWRTSEAREESRWRHIVSSVLDDLTDRQACFAELFAHFARPDAWICLPGVPQTLATLAERGYHLGLASNFDSRLRPVVSGLSALRPLQSLLISSEVGWRKPSAKFFDALLASLALPPEQILFVGDDPINDGEGALAAGLQVRLLAPGQNLSELLGLR